MKLLGITGATGLLGGRFLRQVVEVMPEVRVRCLARHVAGHLEHPAVEWMSGDLMNEADCAEFVEGLDAVAHFAQSNSPAISDRHWPSDLVANISPGLNLLEALRRRKGDEGCHFVFASSGGAVYGKEPADGVAFRETDECRPLSPYGIQKLAVEHYLRTACEQGWLRATVLRISNAYGELLAAERRQGLIGVAMARVLAGQAVKVFGPIETVRDYVHVDDVARAFGKALGSPGMAENHRVFNIAAGVGHSVAEVLALIGRVTGREVRLEHSDFGKAAIGLLPRVVLANGKAREELGWGPRIGLEEGVFGLMRDLK
jgi:UDP-glucose 4-epimerase